ncbi:ABC transporter substrate-binding protein [Dactylosporangium sp. CA-092794]|uniref:ABC transporter substrate-binding protein n=1 Tax=Dactylosporangium sp. CA-092794 TaxID=3239929 RepID=UPI003D8B7A7E
MLRTLTRSMSRKKVSSTAIRHVGTVAAVAGVLALATACTSSGSDAGKPGTSGAGIAKVAYTFSEVQGVLLDPVENKGGYQPWMQLMYDTMIHQTPQGLEPGLAVKWDFPDAKTIDLTLRQGVKFQDGTPFDAAAVKFSWERVMASKTMQKSAALAAMTSIDTPSTDRVVVHLNGPYAAEWRDQLLKGAVYLAVVSPAAVQQAGSGFASKPLGAGAGPYGFSSYASGQSIKLTASPNYWDQSAVTLAGVEFVNTAGGAPTIAALKSGVVNMAFTTGGASISSAKSQGLTVANSVVRPDWEYGAYFCTDKAPFDKLDARKAVAYALNRAAFVSGPYGGYAVENSTTIPTTSTDWPGKTVANPYEYSIDKAKAALAAAGVSPGTTITAIADPTDVNSATLQILQSQLKAVGLDLSIVPSANAFADLRSKKPSIYFQGSGFPYGAQGIFVQPGGVANYCSFDDPSLDAALAKATDPTLDPAATPQAWAEYQKVYYDTLPGINIADIQLATITTKAVSGVSKTMDLSNGQPQSWAGLKVNA